MVCLSFSDQQDSSANSNLKIYFNRAVLHGLLFFYIYTAASCLSCATLNDIHTIYGKVKNLCCVITYLYSMLIYNYMSEIVDYIAPECRDISLELESQILVLSGSLNDMSDNPVYREEF